MAELTELKNGMPLGGDCVLGDFIRSHGRGAFYHGSTGTGDQVLVKLLPKPDPETEAQLSAWERTRTLNHAHLQNLRQCGDAPRHLYAVLERPDDMLASALAHGPLSEEETGGVLVAVLAGLRHLHSKGLVHGAVDAEHVIAVGDTVKLATDGLRVSDDKDAQAEDLRQVKALARRLSAPGPLSPSIEKMLSASLPAPKTVPAKLPEWESQGQPQPAPVPPQVEAVEPATGGNGYTKWVLAAVAALAAIFVIFGRGTPEAPVKKPVPEVARKAPQPAAEDRRPSPFADSRAAAPAVELPPPAKTRTEPPAVKARPEAPAVKARAAAASTVQSGDWRVIALTYRSQEMAAKKVAQINAQWPGMRAEVFEPKDSRGYFLVSLGGWMTRAGAEELRRKARSQGLPQDTYVQNYNQ